MVRTSTAQPKPQCISPSSALHFTFLQRPLRAAGGGSKDGGPGLVFQLGSQPLASVWSGLSHADIVEDEPHSRSSLLLPSSFTLSPTSQVKDTSFRQEYLEQYNWKTVEKNPWILDNEISLYVKS